MLSKTNQNCDQNFVDIGAFSLVNSDWEEFENEKEKKTFKLYCYSNIDHLVESWYTWILKILQSCLKKKTNHKRSQPPYITPSNSNLIKKKY